MTDRELDSVLAQLEVPENRYRADLELHDRSLTLSSELLKIALAGVAVVGFLATSLPQEYVAVLQQSAWTQFFAGLSLLAFVGSAACALMFRFSAGGAFFHHLNFVKLLFAREKYSGQKSPGFEDRIEKEIESELNGRGVMSRRYEHSLNWSGRLLVVAAILLGLALGNMVMHASPSEAGSSASKQQVAP